MLYFSHDHQQSSSTNSPYLYSNNISTHPNYQQQYISTKVTIMHELTYSRIVSHCIYGFICSFLDRWCKLVSLIELRLRYGYGCWGLRLSLLGIILGLLFVRLGCCFGLESIIWHCHRNGLNIWQVSLCCMRCIWRVFRKVWRGYWKLFQSTIFLFVYLMIQIYISL